VVLSLVAKVLSRAVLVALVHARCDDEDVADLVRQTFLGMTQSRERYRSAVHSLA